MHPDKKRYPLIAEVEQRVLDAKVLLAAVAKDVQQTCPHTIVVQGEGNGRRICPKCGLEEVDRYGTGKATNLDWWNVDFDKRPAKLGNHEDRIAIMVSDHDFYSYRLKG